MLGFQPGMALIGSLELLEQKRAEGPIVKSLG